jgi:hypothetical protein
MNLLRCLQFSLPTVERRRERDVSLPADEAAATAAAAAEAKASAETAVGAVAAAAGSRTPEPMRAQPGDETAKKGEAISIFGITASTFDPPQAGATHADEHMHRLQRDARLVLNLLCSIRGLHSSKATLPT